MTMMGMITMMLLAISHLINLVTTHFVQLCPVVIPSWGRQKRNLGRRWRLWPKPMMKRHRLKLSQSRLCQLNPSLPWKVRTWPSLQVTILMCRWWKVTPRWLSPCRRPLVMLVLTMVMVLVVVCSKIRSCTYWALSRWRCPSSCNKRNAIFHVEPTKNFTELFCFHIVNRSFRALLRNRSCPETTPSQPKVPAEAAAPATKGGYGRIGLSFDTPLHAKLCSSIYHKSKTFHGWILLSNKKEHAKHFKFGTIPFLWSSRYF